MVKECCGCAPAHVPAAASKSAENRTKIDLPGVMASAYIVCSLCLKWQGICDWRETDSSLFSGIRRGHDAGEARGAYFARAARAWPTGGVQADVEFAAPYGPGNGVHLIGYRKELHVTLSPGQVVEASDAELGPIADPARVGL